VPNRVASARSWGRNPGLFKVRRRTQVSKLSGVVRSCPELSSLGNRPSFSRSFEAGAIRPRGCSSWEAAVAAPGTRWPQERRTRHECSAVESKAFVYPDRRFTATS
jgi:hypothetical protein